MAFLMGVMALATTSCESDMDNNPVFQKPTSFVLNTPKYASGLYDLKNTDAVQLAAGRGTDIEQIVYRKRIHDFFVVVRFDPRNGVRLFVIASHFGEDLVKRYSH